MRGRPFRVSLWRHSEQSRSQDRDEGKADALRAILLNRRRRRHLSGLLLKEGGAERRKIEWLEETQFQQYRLEGRMPFAPSSILCFRRKLCTFGAFYLPPLRGTLFQKRAFTGVASRHFRIQRPITRPLRGHPPPKEGFICGGSAAFLISSPEATPLKTNS